VETRKGESIVSFQCLGLEPTDCLSIGYFFANKQLDNVCCLDLKYCNIHDVEVGLLMTELQHGKQQQEGGVLINLSLSQISHYGMLSISEALKSPTSVLYGLVFACSWHPQITNIFQALKYLIEGLSRNTSCKELNLTGCCLKPSHIHHLVIMVTFSNLKILCLSRNNLKGAVCLLAEVVKHNKTLIYLQLIECNISDADLVCLGKAIKTNTTLDILVLRQNPFSSTALKRFVLNWTEEAGSDLVKWVPPDWVERPPFIDMIQDHQLKEFASKLNGVWKELGREVTKMSTLLAPLSPLVTLLSPYMAGRSIGLPVP